MSDPFWSPRQRLASAQVKTAEFQSAFEDFVRRKPYASVIDIDPSSGDKIYKVKMTESLPAKLTDLTMEAIEALRSSLDQIGYACGVLGGKPKPKSALFPFADSAADLANAIKGRCKDLPSEIVELFRSFQPYQGGNDILWAMNKIANMKHTVLVSVGNASSSFHIVDAYLSGGSGQSSIAVPRWDGANNEMVFARVAADGEFQYQINFAFYVAFGDVPALAGQPVLAALDHLASVVSGILSTTEAECRRIRLLR